MGNPIMDSMWEKTKPIIDPTELPKPEDYLKPAVVDAEVVEAEVVDEEAVKSEPEAIKPQIVETTAPEPMKRSELLRGEFKHFFGEDAFPLTAGKMEYLAQFLEPNGQLQFGFYFTAELHRECTLLLPRPVYCWYDPYWKNVLYTWRNNPCFFRCSVIGKILEIYSKIVEAEYADFCSNL